MDTLFERKIRVFISSTYKDLRRERKQVIDTLISLPQMQPINMENFGARPSPPLEECLSLLKNSHIYIGIIGACCGSSDETGKSFTEYEYDQANYYGLPSYIYLLQDAPPCPEENAEQQSRLEVFKKKISQATTFARCRRSELAQRLATDLSRDLGVGKEIAEARDTLRIFSLIAKPVEYDVWRAMVFWTLFRPSQEPYHQRFSLVNDLRAQLLWDLFSELAILYRRGARAFGTDPALLQRLRRKMEAEPHRTELQQALVDYFIKRLGEWTPLNDTVIPKSPQDVQDERHFLLALKISDRDLKDAERVLKLVDGLCFDYETDHERRVGFLTYWGEIKKALRCLNIAKRYAHHQRLSTEELIDARIAELKEQINGAAL